jgi:hypothetical protein
MDTNTYSKPKRVTRTEAEMRGSKLIFRCSRQEADDLYQYARARKATMSYMIREALKEKYPDIFGNANRHIRKPRKPKPQQERAQIMHSLADGSIRILDKTP